MITEPSADPLPHVIDVEELMTRCMGNLEFADRILNVFQSRCDEDLLELEQAIIAKDMQCIERIAHRLKGACANAGARRMQDCATQLWNAANGRRSKEVKSRFDDLRHEWAQSTHQLSLSNVTSSEPTRE